jgi:hypothetical protein
MKKLYIATAAVAIVLVLGLLVSGADAKPCDGNRCDKSVNDCENGQCFEPDFGIGDEFDCEYVRVCFIDDNCVIINGEKYCKVAVDCATCPDCPGCETAVDEAEVADETEYPNGTCAADE